MELTKEQIEAIVSHLGAKFPDSKCPVCDKNTWDLQRRVFQFTECASLIMGGAAIPAVVVVCKNCGNMLFLNAILLGIVERDKTKEKGEGKEGAEAVPKEAADG